MAANGDSRWLQARGLRAELKVQTTATLTTCHVSEAAILLAYCTDAMLAMRGCCLCHDPSTHRKVLWELCVVKALVEALGVVGPPEPQHAQVTLQLLCDLRR